MTKLVETDFFDEDQVKARHPLLYHMYLGRFQSQATENNDKQMV